MERAGETLPGLDRLTTACREKEKKLRGLQSQIEKADATLAELRHHRPNPVQLARKRLLLAEIQLNLCKCYILTSVLKVILCFSSDIRSNGKGSDGYGGTSS